ncbi:HAD-IC family P-type ATPase [Schaalia sp. 19OD2882]|uniref:HAD-IC family P-type ATPase n=1 Tax=Schaalia sp. 19OD2882 TaxID=2794089 RepID=UPI0020A7B055|nr:HAD-IC family P-type ATPase [Schaalia sp. 19OD2882]
MAKIETARPLGSDEVAQRVRDGRTNSVELPSSRSLASIARANLLTLFNAILLVAMVVVLLFGHWQDVVFGGVMILNSAIGIVSEWRAKRTLDALAIVDAPRAHVRRAEGTLEMLVGEVVQDDLVELALGDQVCVDGALVEADGLEVDESMLTGESRPVRKDVGDEVLAGTSVVAGSGLVRADRVGADLWAQGIARQARTFSLATSEIQQGVDKVLRVISFALLPVVALTVWSQYRISADLGPDAWKHALVLAVAAVVGMIPQGLVLLTSMNFAIGSAALARRNVLVQELPAVEVLARVDALCLDKTGTLTTGGISVGQILPSVGVPRADVESALATMNSSATNPTAEAVCTALEGVPVWSDTAATEVPFSSARKWAAWVSPEHGTWLFGAPEILLEAVEGADEVLEQVSAIADQGRRVVALVRAHVEGAAALDVLVEDGHLPAGRTPAALVVLDEELRPDASQTLDWFCEQGVAVRVISGDNSRTVGALATRLGLRNPDGGAARSVDARTLPQDLASPEFADAICSAEVFGRVSPEQKRAMVRALQSRGHCVAMTGDGVNDALALKDADLGIAMGNAARATKAVAQVVLLDGRFSQLPEVVARGRRIIANMERVSSLFLSKTTYASVFVLATALLAWPFPFLPRHYTYIGSLTIGIPAFFIALGPNTRRYLPGFLGRTLSLAVPAGIVMSVTALVVYWLVGVGTVEGQSAATLTMAAGGVWLLGVTARPLVPWRVALLVCVTGAAVLGVLIPLTRTFFALTWPSVHSWVVIAVAAVVVCTLIEAVHWWRLIRKH